MTDDAPDTSAPPKAKPPRWRLSQRLRPTLVLVLGMLAVFTAFRAAMWATSPAAREGVTDGQLVGCFTTGFGFDCRPIGCAALPLALALALAPPAAFGKRWFRRTVTAYVTALMGLVVLAEAIGAYYFAYNGVRMDWVAADYLRNPREVIGYVWGAYPVVWVGIGIFAMVGGAYWVLARFFWRGAAPSGPLRRRVLLAAACAGACVVSIRGGPWGMPLRVPSAGVSDNWTLNQLANNGIFYFATAYWAQSQDNRDEIRFYPFPAHDRAVEVAKRMLYQPQDQDLHVPDNPLWRRSDTGSTLRDYNVVVLIMESMTGKGIGAMGYSPTCSPRLDELCKRGLFFENAFAVGRRTNRALVGVLCGHPEMAGVSILSRPRALGRFLNLPGVLRHRGYKTVFVYGGRPDWDNVRNFFSGDGIEEFIGQDEGLTSTEGGNWGVPDEYTFRAANERFKAYGSQKFFAVILNVSNHEPFIVPAGRVPMMPEGPPDAKLLNATRYADWAIGEFFAMAKRQEYFHRTIFVLVADHGRQDLTEGQLTGVPNYRVPLLFYAPGMLPAERIATIASQTDIAPTVLGMLGGSYEHCFMGRNLLSVDAGDGFALLQHDAGWLSLVRGDLAVTMTRGTKARVHRLDAASRDVTASTDPALAATLQEEMLSEYYMGIKLYWDAAYRAPASSAAAGPVPSVVEGPVPCFPVLWGSMCR